MKEDKVQKSHFSEDEVLMTTQVKNYSKFLLFRSVSLLMIQPRSRLEKHVSPFPPWVSNNSEIVQDPQWPVVPMKSVMTFPLASVEEGFAFQNQTFQFRPTCHIYWTGSCHPSAFCGGEQLIQSRHQIRVRWPKCICLILPLWYQCREQKKKDHASDCGFLLLII